jgi:hypothetical protein
LQEVCKQELMENIMKVEGRDVKIYWVRDHFAVLAG